MCALGRRSLEEADRKAIDAALTDRELALDAVPDALEAHGLMPLAYRHLVARPGASVPSALADAISSAFRRHTARQMAFVPLLRRVLAAFEAGGIDVRPFKGPLLALRLYGHHALRQYGDLDFLVRPEHADAALRLLHAEGIVSGDGAAPSRYRYFRRTRHTRSLRDRRTGIPVELHWGLVDRRDGLDVRMAWLMEDSEAVDLLGSEVRAIAAERLLLVLAVQGATRNWERLGWLADVAQLMRSRPGVDWELIAREAARIGFSRQLASTLMLTAGLFDTAPAEPGPAGWKGDRGASKLAARIAARLSRPSVSGLTSIVRFRLRPALVLRRAFRFVRSDRRRF
jgi:hypothetical protein